MNLTRIIFYTFTILFFSSLAVALYTVSKTRMTGTYIDPRIEDIKISTYQVNPWIAHDSPFYFPFEARPASMSTYYPFTQDYGSLIKINSQGFRTAEYTTSRPPNTFRILVFGDLLTSGAGVPVEETYPYVAARLLNNQCAKVQTEIINLGTAGHRFADNVIKYFVHGRSLKPDLVIFQVRVSDMDFYPYVAFFDIQGVTDLYNAYAKKRREIFHPDSLDWKVFAQGVKEISIASKANSTPVIFLVFPPINRSKSQNNWDGFNPNIINAVPEFGFTETISAEVQKYNFPSLNLLETFRKNATDQYLAVSPTSVDLNAYGHRLVAHALTPFLLKDNLFKCEASSWKSDSKWAQEKELRRDASVNWLKYARSFSAQITLYEKLRDLHPNDVWISSQLADSYYLTERWQDALASYSSLVRMEPRYAAPWSQIAFTLGGVPKSKEFLEKTLRTAPDQTIALEFLAKIYLRNKQVGEACNLLRRLMQIPAYPEQYDLSKKLYDSNRCTEVLGKVKPQLTNVK